MKNDLPKALPKALLDTNVFLEFLLDQEDAEACDKVIDALSRGRFLGYLTHYALHALETILNRQKRDHELISFLKHLIDLETLTIYSTRPEEELAIAELLLDLPLDFDDALQYYVAKTLSVPIVTLDQDFRKIKGVSIYSPKEWLKIMKPHQSKRA